MAPKRSIVIDNALFGQPADDTAYARVALAAFTIASLPLDPDSDPDPDPDPDPAQTVDAGPGTAANLVNAASNANGARAASLTLELIVYRADDEASERLILRDAGGTHPQIIYDARTLNHGHLLNALAMLVQRLRRQVMRADEEGGGA